MSALLPSPPSTPIPQAALRYDLPPPGLACIPPPFADPVSKWSSAKHHARKRDAAHVPRPRNKFILFRSDYAAWVAPSVGDTVKQRDISRAAGLVWRGLNEWQRKPWESLANDEKKLHKRIYPEYRFDPCSKGRSAVQRPKNDKRSRASPGRGRQVKKELYASPGVGSQATNHVDCWGLLSSHPSSELPFMLLPEAQAYKSPPQDAGRRRSSSCPPISSTLLNRRYAANSPDLRQIRDDTASRRPSRVSVFHTEAFDGSRDASFFAPAYGAMGVDDSWPTFTYPPPTMDARRSSSRTRIPTVSSTEMAAGWLDSACQLLHSPLTIGTATSSEHAQDEHLALNYGLHPSSFVLPPPSDPTAQFGRMSISDELAFSNPFSSTPVREAQQIFRAPEPVSPRTTSRENGPNIWLSDGD